MDYIWTYFDGGTDGWTLFVAFVIVGAKIAFRWYKKHPPLISTKACGSDLLNGAVIVPFGMMILAVFSHDLRPYAQNGSLLNGLAGGIGLFFVIGEILSHPLAMKVS